MHNLIEALGGLVVLVGLGVLAAAATMVDVRLGVLVVGVELVAVGLVAIYLASELEKASAAKPAIKVGDRP